MYLACNLQELLGKHSPEEGELACEGNVTNVARRRARSCTVVSLATTAELFTSFLYCWGRLFPYLASDK